MQPRTLALIAANVCAVVVTALAIEFTGGLPSQLAHLYYVAIVLSALLLPLRYSICIALLAALAVSPVPDLIHRPLGREVYFGDASPFNLSTQGWIVRPIAFIGVSILASLVVGAHRARRSAENVSAARAQELSMLSRIDRLILAGAPEERALGEIAQFVGELSGARFADIAIPDEQGKMTKSLYGWSRDTGISMNAEPMPLTEGASGWALTHAKPATSGNVFEDPRYDEMREHARKIGVTSCAAVPIKLDGEVLGALTAGFSQVRDFSRDDIATLERIADQAAIAVANARQRESLRRLSYETAIGLAEAIEGRDPYTGDHCLRLAGYATRLASEIGLGGKELEVVRLGAALHDVGKIVVPDSILKKPESLTPTEYNIIKQHCYHGGQICKRISTLRAAHPIVYHHHERWDGRGYPDGLAGEDIPLGARIVAIVDAYDAITSDRPYRRARMENEAHEILRDGAGKQWDPTLVEVFFTLERDAAAGIRRAA